VDPGDFRAVQWENGRYPQPFEGSWMFAGGSAAQSRMYQDVDLSSLQALVDQGGVTAHLGGFVRDWNVDDAAYLQIEARDAAGTRVAGAQTAPLENNVWQRREVGVRLPPGARTVRAVLRAVRQSGADNDAYFDGLDVCLGAEPPTAEETLAVAPYLTWITPDGVSIAWETTTTTTGRVAYGSTPELGSVVAATAAGTHQRMRLTGLSPGTRYYYRVEGSSSPGALHTFRTAPIQAEPFSFVVWGDNQNGPEVFTGLVRQMLGLGPDFALAVGDVVQEGLEENYRYQLLGPLAPLTASIPLLVAPGNHEHASDPNHLLFDARFQQPGHCFGWTYANVAFLVIDSAHPLPGSPTQPCLDEVFASAAFAAADFRVALFHEPPRVEYWAGGGTTGTEWVRTLLEPQLQAAGVDLVLNGHSHVYAYGPKSLTGNVTWVTTGGGGGGLEAPTDLVQSWPQITVVHFRHHFVHVSVDGPVLTAKAIADTGEVLHTFELER
jgi:hypothetical protein